MRRACGVEHEWGIRFSEFERHVPPVAVSGARSKSRGDHLPWLVRGQFHLYDCGGVQRAAGGPILCGLQAALFGTDTTGVSDFVAETDQATATRSGNQATCQVVIPYAWTLSVPTFDTVTLSGSATAVDSNGNGRTSSFQLEVIAVPPTGTVTTITYSGKLWRLRS